MVAFVCVVIASLLVHAEDFVAPADDPNDGPYYNCSKLTSAGEEACKVTGFCVWSTTNLCVYDKCIKYVPDDGGNPCSSQVGGVDCTLYYITDIHDCNTGAPIQTDRYCRTNSNAFHKSDPFDKCFFDDLKSRETNSGATSCGKKWCQSVTASSSNTGSYCKQIGPPSENDCSLAFGVDDVFFCDCLGPEHCDLYPDCIVSSNKCIPDPCSVGEPQTVGQDCISVGSIPNCKTKRRQTVVNNAIVDQRVCRTSTNNKDNECFFAYNFTLAHSTAYPTYPECDTVQQNMDVCGLAFTYKSDGSNDVDKKCALQPIAAGYFPFPQYCTDGDRTVPSPDAASVSRVHLFLLVAIFSLLYFL